LANGLQRATRLTAIQLPRMAPYRSIASYPYSEQLGTYRHVGGMWGETINWYPRTSLSSTQRAGLGI
jgi:hypothetical protein